MSMIMSQLLEFLETKIEEVEDYKELNNFARVIGSMKPAYSHAEDRLTINRLLKNIESKVKDTSNEIILKDNNKTYAIINEFILQNISPTLPLLITGSGDKAYLKMLTEISPKSKPKIHTSTECIEGCCIIAETEVIDNVFHIVNVAVRTDDALLSLFYRREDKIVRITSLPPEVKTLLEAHTHFLKKD